TCELSMIGTETHDLLFRTLADPTRRAIFEKLCREGDHTVGALTASAGVSQPAVSTHLRILKSAGLVSDHQQGRQSRYRARRDALAPLADWTKEMAGFWESRFDGLESLLERMDQCPMAPTRIRSASSWSGKFPI